MCVLCSQFAEQLTELKKQAEKQAEIIAKQHGQIEQAFALLAGFQEQLKVVEEQRDSAIVAAQAAQQIARRILDDGIAALTGKGL